jgi:hypothetical protein
VEVLSDVDLMRCLSKESSSRRRRRPGHLHEFLLVIIPRRYRFVEKIFFASHNTVNDYSRVLIRKLPPDSVQRHLGN